MGDERSEKALAISKTENSKNSKDTEKTKNNEKQTEKNKSQIMKNSPRIVRFPLRGVRYFLMVVIFITSAIMIDTGNPLGFPILVLTIIFVVWEVVQKVSASSMIKKNQWNFLSNILTTREGKQIRLNNEELQEKDIIELVEGDVVPVNCKIIKSKNLEVRENSHQMATKKNIGDFLKERSYVTYGYCEAEIKEKSHFTECMPLLYYSDILSWNRKSLLTGFVLALVAFFLGSYAGINAVEMFLISASLMVLFSGLGPSAASAFISSRAVKSLAEKGLPMSRASNLEKFSNVSVILADSEAFTTGAPSVSSVYVDNKMFAFQNGAFMLEDKAVNIKKYRDLTLVLASGTMSSTATINPTKHGDNQEIALLEAAESVGLEDTRGDYEALQLGAFSKQKGRAIAGYKIGNKAVYYARGSVDSILEICSQVLSEGKAKKMTESEALSIKEIAKATELKGNNVIVLAVKRTLVGKPSIEKDFMLVGLISTSNSLDERSKEMIQHLSKIGVKTIFTTGTDKETSVSIANSIGLNVKEEDIMTRRIMEKLSDEELGRKAASAKIIVEVKPEDKARIIQSLQKLGYTVLSTGSHGEDISYMSISDVAVAASQSPMYVKVHSGCEMKGGLSSINAAITESVNSRKKIGRALEYNQMISFGSAFVVLAYIASVLIGNISFVISPIPLLWIGLLSSIVLMSVAFGKASESIQLPRRIEIESFSGSVIKSIVIAIVPVLAVFTLHPATSASFAISFLLFAIALGTLYRNMGMTMIVAVAAMIVHIIFSSLISGLALSAIDLIIVFVSSAAVIAAVEMTRNIRKPSAAHVQLKSSKVKVAMEGWKGSRLAELLKKSEGESGKS